MRNMRERVGVAVNAASLEWNADHEMPIDRVAALAFSDHLVSLLWRLKYGQQRGGGVGYFSQAALILARTVRAKAKAKRWRGGGPDIVERIVRRALEEWLEARCEACYGRGMVGLERGAVRSVRVRCPECRGEGRIGYVSIRGGKRHRVCARCCGNGRVSVTREVPRGTVRPCSACGGSGRKLPAPAERAAALGIPKARYDARWDKRIDDVVRWLEQVDARGNWQVYDRLRLET